MSNTVEVTITKNNQVIIEWTVFSMAGMRLLMEKVLDASKEQIAQYEEELKHASINSYSSFNGEYTMITTNVR
ncbi:hypothetical protein HWC66_gp86 [Gordonia phage Chikenjars]|uniref:Uncharacterized protein n=1 Tax=Gordonia phage Chikenjars TaxID=2601686 RepID=A0A5J6D940_9CAUD|nr:hypothetical protein HWC66_gp86 [Gordonia phage Chikenjars]QEQ94389.1 hypothetical protein SEA_CHIKENJARS_86 [Gordonia phage Chikenjars]